MRGGKRSSLALWSCWSAFADDSLWNKPVQEAEFSLFFFKGYALIIPAGAEIVSVNPVETRPGFDRSKPIRSWMGREDGSHLSIGPYLSRPAGRWHRAGEWLAGIQVVGVNPDGTLSFTPSNTNMTIVNNYIADSNLSGMWIGELNGGTLNNNLVIRYFATTLGCVQSPQMSRCLPITQTVAELAHGLRRYRRGDVSAVVVARLGEHIVDLVRVEAR
jgi:hypothetical protein